MDRNTWNEMIAALPGAHPLQTWDWGQVKARYGWEPIHKVWRDPQERVLAAALVLSRSASLPGLGGVMYLPRGPLLSDWNDPDLRRQVFGDLESMGRERSAIFLKIDPEVEVGRGIPGLNGAQEDPVGAAVNADLKARGWISSTDQIQFRNTVLIDLHPEIEELQALLKQKTRYNIRLAGKKGVKVRRGSESDFEALYAMYAETAQRDGFVIRDREYYRAVWKSFFQAGLATPVIAEVEELPVAGIVLFHFAGRAWFLYGMSRDAHREKMPNYLLQWEAIRLAKEMGCFQYDLWGAPDEFNAGDRLWGVYRFKEGFGGRVVRFIGAWDRPVKPLNYRLYTNVMPQAMALLRWRGRAKTRQSLMS